MKRVRILSPFVPYPPSEGSFHVLLNQILYFSKCFDDVQVISWKNSPSEFAEKTAQINSKFGLTNVRWTDFSSRVKRPLRAVRLAKSLISEWASPELYYYPPLIAPADLETVDLEIFNYTFGAPWLKRWAGRAKRRTCVAHNIESDLYREKRDAETNSIARFFHSRTITKLERHLSLLEKAFDEFWCVSASDARTLRERLPFADIRVTAPNYDGWQGEAPSFIEQTKTTVGFIGGMDFGPNRESARFLIEEIAPLLIDTNAHMILGGKCPPMSLLRSASHFPFIEFPGFVVSIDDFWNQLDGFLIPHVVGSGVRTKLLEALARRVPTITNTAGFARIDSELKKISYLHVSDDPKEWARLIASGQLRQERIEALKAPFPAALLGEWTFRDVNTHFD